MPAESAGRGSAELWLDAAYEALLEGGVDAVKILPLASRLGLSRTSFYWFFEDREALLSALLRRWEEKNTGGLVGATKEYSETPVEALLNIMGCFLETKRFDPLSEFAVRSWALQSSEVMAKVNAADEVRLAALRGMLERHGYSALDADVRARTIYLVQIGYISMQVREDLATRMRRIPTHVRIYSGTEPQPRELARFYARHSYVPEDAEGAGSPSE